MIYIRKYHGWHFLLIALVIFSVLSTSLLGILTSMPAKAASNSGKWVRVDTPTQGCPNVWAAIDFTNSLGQPMQQFTCHNIHKILDNHTGGRVDQMVLSGPTDICNTDPSNTSAIFVAANDTNGGVTEDFRNSKSATFSGWMGASKQGCNTINTNFQLDNTFADVKGDQPPPPTPPQTVGSGAWTEPLQINQAEITVTDSSGKPGTYTFTDSSGNTIYTSPKGEVFDQQALISSAGILTLNSSSGPALGNKCDPDYISYGPDQTSQQATVTISLWGYENGSDLHCYQRSGTLNLSKSYADIGGTLDGGSNPSFSNGNCPIKGDGDWLFCMIADVASGAIDALGGALTTMLYTPVDQIFGQSTMRDAFNSFRNIAVAFLVIVGLFMVFSQAAGLEMFAAYTVRKALPRLVIAMIGISLAWPILQFVLTFFNDIGVWAMQLILGSVGVGATGAPLSSFNFGSGLILVLTAAGALLFSTGIVMSLLGTLLLALIVGFIVLAIRQLVILIAILLAPLAIAASILPSTQKMWHFWRETLLTALAMFPIMMAFLGAGKAMSVIAGNAAEATTDGGRSFTWKLLSVMCMIVPLFAMPFAFRIAGGLVGTAHALVSGGKLGKGLFNRLSEYRGKKAAERWQETKGGQLLKQNTLPTWIPGSRFRGRAADFLSKGASTGALIASGHLDRGRRNAYRTNAEAAHALETGGKDPDFSPARGNEDYYLAGLRGYSYKYKDASGAERVGTTDGSEAGARAYFQRKGYSGKGLVDAVGQTNLMKRKLGQHGFEIAAAMYTPGSGTAFGEGGVAEMDQVIANAARGDRALAAQILNVARQNATAAGRIDLSGAGFATHLREIQSVMNGGTANGDRLNIEAFMSQDAVTLGRAKKKSLELIMKSVTAEITDLQGKRPMTQADETQIVGLEAQLKNPAVTGAVRTRVESDLSALRKEVATEDEQRNLGRLTESLDRLRKLSLQYAAPERNIPIYEAVNNTYGATRKVDAQDAAAARTPQAVMPNGNLEPLKIDQQTVYGAREQNMGDRYSRDQNEPFNQPPTTTPPPVGP